MSFPRGTYTAGRGPRGREHYWLDSAPYPGGAPSDSDVATVEAGAVSVTPLRLDLTDPDLLDAVSGETAEAGAPGKED